MGPYKGGLRFHPSVYLGIIKFLGFEQIFKNSLTGLPIGGAKGGSDFDPKGKSDGEVMRFCQSFMTRAVPAHRRAHRRPRGRHRRGRPRDRLPVRPVQAAHEQVRGRRAHRARAWIYGGSQVRTEATGYGCTYFVEEMLKAKKNGFKGKKVVVSGSGNVAIYTLEKVHQLGGKVIAMSDSNGVIVDEKGFNLETIKMLKEVERRRIKDYCDYHKHAKYVQGGSIWDVPCDVAMPSATQNEITGKDARKLVKNGCIAVGEGANMPTHPGGDPGLPGAGVLFGPAKAANAGGVATSALEMQQNAGRDAWEFEETDAKLHQIMRNIYRITSEAAEEFGSPGNFVVGANIGGFLKVARAMMAHGLV